jgi:hypothetical protein
MFMAISSVGAWPWVSVKGMFYRFTGAPTWDALALSAHEAGDVFFKVKMRRHTPKSNRNTLRETRYFIKNFISLE